MARSPSNKRNIYSDRDFPGCMGGIMHLFDFNQALAGRRLLTDKKYGEGLEAPRNSLDVGGSIPEVPKPSTAKSEEVPFGYEIRKTSTSKKPSGMPIKALIAQELSKEPESKNRSPNVVARLMGLDALPADPKSVQKPMRVTAVEKPVLKPQSERQRHEEKPPHNVKLYAKKVKTPPVQPPQESPASRSSQHRGTDWEDDKAGFESLPFRNHPQEQQLQEFKKEFEAWQSQKSGDHPRLARPDDLDLQVAAKHMLARERLHETKLAFAQEKFASTKHNAPQERLHESKEFLDAMDFLQSNKEFFMRFLQEPNSLLARHLQDNQPDSKPSQPTQAMKHRRSHRMPDPYGSRSEEYRPNSRGKESPDSRRNYRSEQHSQKSTGADLMSERNLVSSTVMPSFATEVSLRLQDRQKHSSSPVSSDNRTGSADCQVPTRIVVLKPSPGRVRNLKSISPSYPPQSPKGCVDPKEVIRDDAKDVLQELRERLRKEGRENYKQERRNTRQSLNDHYRDGSRDPREIAREIARQVRESVTRDLMVDSGRFRTIHSTLSSATSGRRTQPSRPASEMGDMAGSSDGEPCAPSKRLYWDNYNRSSPPISPRQSKSLDTETVHGSREGKKRGSERFRMLNAEQSDESQSQGQSIVLRKGGYFEDSRQTSPGSKSSHGLKAHSRHSVDGLDGNQNHRRMLFHVDSDRDHELLRLDAAGDLEGPAGRSSLRNGEESKDSSPRTLLRSRSVPTASASADRSLEDLQIKRAGANTSEFSEAGVEKAVSKSVVESNRTSDAATRSIFSRKVSGLKGSFSLSRKRGSSKERVDQVSLSSEQSTALELREDVSASSHTDQFQVEDFGPSADNDTCGSALGNSVSVEAALIVEDFLGADGQTPQPLAIVPFTCDNSSEKFVEREDLEIQVECEQQCSEIVAVLEDSQNSSQSLPASPQRLSCLANDAPTSSTTESSKEKSEQPSPVSVLDVPFQEEIASPMDFKEISSDLQELRMRLRLLKFDDREPGPDLETMHEEDGLVTEEKTLRDTDNCSQTAAEFDTMAGSDFPLSDFEHADFQNIVMDEVECPSGKEPEMLYVKNILIASGFTGDSTVILTRWYAPSQPLDPCLFQKMEGSYSFKGSEIQEGSQINVKPCTEGDGLLDSSSRRLLFDRVNEVLLEMLGPHLNRRLWMNPFKVTVFSMPSGNELVKLVWTEVCRLSCSQSEAQDTLENLVTKDLARGGQWMDLTFDIETVGLEVERAIFNDLIEETLLVL